MKMIIIILIAVIFIGGTFVGLGYVGVVKIPGITPEKKSSATKAQQEAVGASRTEETKTDSQKTASGDQAAPPPKPPVDQAAALPKAGPAAETVAPPAVVQRKDGTLRLAALWSSMDAETVKKILIRWEDGDVLPVLAKMSDAKLAELLAAIANDDAERAARISKGIKALEKGGK